MTSPATAPRRRHEHVTAEPARPDAGRRPAASRQQGEQYRAYRRGTTREHEDANPDATGRQAADIDAYIRDLVASAPPLTPAQCDRLALLFSGGGTTRPPRRDRKDGATLVPG
jgi:hypothetical protein